MKRFESAPAENPLGRTLIIVNPAAQSGAAAEIGERLQRFLRLYLHGPASFDLALTAYPRHATALARGATGYDTVLAVGGDEPDLLVPDVLVDLMTCVADKNAPPDK